MRLNSYLSRSRHGIFYFRWPMPNRTIPEKRTSFRLSLRTRCPKLAWEKRRLSLDAYDYSEPSSNALPTDEPTGTAADTFTLQQAIDEYVYEGKRAGTSQAPTQSKRITSLGLLTELSGPVAF